MYSSLFCGTLEISRLNSEQIKEDDLCIKLYKIELLKFQELVAGLRKFLSGSERNRADRYHFEKDRNRFIICRSLLKFLLSEHIDLNVDKIILDTDSNKKPFLASHPSVFFNVSHAGDNALIAIAKNPIGVDIEYINKDFDYREILPNIFNQIEINEVANSDDKHLIFYRFWTRKEAIVKAIGKGIDDDFSKILVTDGLHSLPSSVVGNFKKIKVFSFHLNDDYIGALALTVDIYNFEKIVFHPLPTLDELRSLIH